jgi:hypothetical protein
MTDLKTLLAKATADDQRDVLETAFAELYPHTPSMGCSSYHNEALDADLEVHNRFTVMLDAEAYVDAALLLLREVLPEWGHASGVAEGFAWAGVLSSDNLPGYDEVLATQALAIIAAIQQAKEAENG